MLQKSSREVASLTVAGLDQGGGTADKKARAKKTKGTWIDLLKGDPSKHTWQRHFFVRAAEAMGAFSTAQHTLWDAAKAAAIFASLQTIAPDHLCTFLTMGTMTTEASAMKIGLSWGFSHSVGTALVFGVIQACRLKMELDLEAMEHDGNYIIGMVLIVTSGWFLYYETSYVVEADDGTITVFACACHAPDGSPVDGVPMNSETRLMAPDGTPIEVPPSNAPAEKVSGEDDLASATSRGRSKAKAGDEGLDVPPPPPPFASDVPPPPAPFKADSADVPPLPAPFKADSADVPPPPAPFKADSAADVPPPPPPFGAGGSSDDAPPPPPPFSGGSAPPESASPSTAPPPPVPPPVGVRQRSPKRSTSPKSPKGPKFTASFGMVERKIPNPHKVVKEDDQQWWHIGFIVGFLQGALCPMSFVALNVLMFLETVDSSVVFLSVYVLTSALTSGFLTWAWTVFSNSTLGSVLSPHAIFRGGCVFMAFFRSVLDFC